MHTIRYSLLARHLLRAYSFGNLKSPKTSQRKMCLAKNAKRMKILKTVGLAEFENKNPKRMGFCKTSLKAMKSTVFGRMAPKEYDFSFFRIYRSQKMPKRRRPKCRIRLFTNAHILNGEMKI